VDRWTKEDRRGGEANVPAAGVVAWANVLCVSEIEDQHINSGRPLTSRSPPPTSAAILRSQRDQPARHLIPR
jgi:hypothetical protein